MISMRSTRLIGERFCGRKISFLAPIYTLVLTFVSAGAAQLPETNSQSTNAPDGFFESLEAYLDSTNNLWANEHVDSYFTEIEDMSPKLGANKQNLRRYEIEYRRIDRSFRYRLQRWKDGQPLNSIPSLDETCGYDSMEGVQRSFGASKSMLQQGKAHARISTWQLVGAFPLMERFGRFFDGTYTVAGEFYIPFLLSHRSDAQFQMSPKTNEVQVTVPLHPACNSPNCGSIRLWFDPLRNYLLTRVEDKFSLPSLHFHHVARVEKAITVNGTWVPQHIIEVCVIPEHHKNGTGAVYEVVANRIRLGELKEADLDVEFPANVTFIDDRIKGERFFVAKDGTKTLANISSSISSPVQVASGPRIVVIVINVLIVVALAAILVYRRSRMAS